MFHLLVTIVEVQWSKPVPQAGKQLVVAWSEIRTAKSVVKQLPVQIITSVLVKAALYIGWSNYSQLKCWNVWAAVCKCALSWRSTITDVTILCFYFWVALCCILVLCKTSLSLLWWISPSPSQKTVTNSILGDKQGLFKHFSLFGECVCFSTHQWNPAFITWYLYPVMENFIIFVVLL
jgi:hypothetical protein